MKGWIIISLAVFVAFLLFGVVETEARSYWQLRFEDGRESSSEYYSSGDDLWCGRTSGRRRFVPYNEFRRQPRYQHRDIPRYCYRGRPRYRGYYSDQYRYYRGRPRGGRGYGRRCR